MNEKNKRNHFGRDARIAKKVKNRIKEIETQREKQGKEPWTEEQRKRYMKWEIKKELIKRINLNVIPNKIIKVQSIEKTPSGKIKRR